eukprot:gene18853-23091_t
MPKKNTPKPSDQSELPLTSEQTPAPVPAAPVEPAAPIAVVVPEPTPASLEVAVVPEKNSPDAPLVKHYRSWFLDYASYVILDRAVPHIDDGLKPVQRRILHTLWDMDDGRFHKVANVVGRAMSLHPHGDASIGAALVGIGQRAFLIEPQGNFGNTLTGDDAAAPRYIEARLTPFAKDV